MDFSLSCNLILNCSLMWFLFVRPEICLYLPSDSPHVNHSNSMNRTPLVLAISFPLLGWIRDFHPLETCAARRTRKTARASGLSIYRNNPLIVRSLAQVGTFLVKGLPQLLRSFVSPLLWIRESLCIWFCVYFNKELYPVYMEMSILFRVFSWISAIGSHRAAVLLYCSIKKQELRRLYFVNSSE